MLYIVATPIGHLADFSFRAIETLKSADFILCEDTRRSGILMKHYGIDSPLRSFHKFSEKKLEDQLIDDLKKGQTIALISDAGTPGISDPGQKLISRCRSEELEVSSIPGACSPIVALTLCGFEFERFQFIGFLPKKENERKKALIDALFYPGVTVCFESPNRVKKTLGELAKCGPKHHVAIVRELTKIYEECTRGFPSELMERDYRGEIIMVIEGGAQTEITMDNKEHVEYLMKEFDLEKKEAIKLSANLKGISKKEVYSCFISKDQV